MSESLYRRLGEDLALQALCEMLYERIRQEADLNRFFTDVSYEKMQQKQAVFLSHILGGPQMDSSLDLRAIHRPLIAMGMEARHFDAIAGFIVEILHDLNVAQRDIAEVAAILTSLKDEVLDR